MTLNDRVMAIIYKYELSLDNFFIGDRNSGPFFTSNSEVQPTWFVNVSDTFMYACADAEEITETNIDLFEQTCVELCDGSFDEIWAPILFVSRLRGITPMKAWLDNEDLSESLRSKFESV